MKTSPRKPILTQWLEYRAKEPPAATPPHAIEDGIQAMIIASELDHPKQYADYREKEYGVLYHDMENRSSRGGNHALILDLSRDLNSAVDDIVAFYTSKGAAPAIFQAFRESEEEKLLPLLRRKNFDVEFYHQTPMVLKEGRTPPFRTDLKVKRIKRVATAIRRDVFTIKSIGSKDLFRNNFREPGDCFIINHIQAPTH